MSDQQTCGPLYKAGLESFTGMDPELIPIFAAGFVSGQAEKVKLGACQAAMFRPSEDWVETVRSIVREVAERYGLAWATIGTSRGLEIWLCKSFEIYDAITSLESLGENSPRWHERRGLLCGVRAHDIDYLFHERAGFGQPCDS